MRIIGPLYAQPPYQGKRLFIIDGKACYVVRAGSSALGDHSECESFGTTQEAFQYVAATTNSVSPERGIK